MLILITGGAGFIGSHLVRRLLAAGNTIRVLDNLSSGKRGNLPADKRLEFVEGDIRDVSHLNPAVSGVEAIFHLAAVASVQASADDPVGTHGSNFMGTLNLLEAARRHRVRRFIYASSAAVYGDSAALPVREDTSLRPLTPYASDKLAGEHYLAFYARKYDIKETAFRFFNIYGPRQDPSSPYSGVISIFVDKARKGQPITVFGDGFQSRDFVYVSDLVEILYRTIERESTAGQIMNVGRGVECSLLDLLDELERLTGKPIERRFEAPRIGDIRNSRADVARLTTFLDYVPPTPIGVGLKELLEYRDEAPGL